MKIVTQIVVKPKIEVLRGLIKKATDLELPFKYAISARGGAVANNS